MLDPQTVPKIWEVFGSVEVDFFSSEENSDCPKIYLSKVGPQLTQPPSLRVPPGCLDSTDNQADQGTEMRSARDGPTLGKPALVGRANSSHLAYSPEARSPLPDEQDDMVPQARAVIPAPVDTRQENVSLLECVLNTHSQVRALMTRHLYALKWSAFSVW